MIPIDELITVKDETIDDQPLEVIAQRKWEPEEDRILLQFYQEYGNKWKTIAELIPGRTAQSVRNRINHLYPQK